MKRIRPTTVFLTLLNVALVAGVVFAWTRGRERIAEPATLIVPALDLPDMSVLTSIPVPSVDVSVLKSQSVFYASRSFYEQPPAPTEVPAPEYEMAGTLRLIDGKRIAFVKKKADRSSRTLHVGDDLDGWRVQAIEPDRLVIDHGGEQIAELRSSTGTGAAGLIREPAAAARPSIAGIRVLGGVGSAVSSGASSSHALEARTYRPPPPVGK